VAGKAWQLVLAAAIAVGLAGQALAEPPLEKTEIRYQGWAGQVTFTELAEVQTSATGDVRKRMARRCFSAATGACR
jgi:hypothetical protein